MALSYWIMKLIKIELAVSPTQNLFPAAPPTCFLHHLLKLFNKSKVGSVVLFYENAGNPWQSRNLIIIFNSCFCSMKTNVHLWPSNDYLLTSEQKFIHFSTEVNSSLFRAFLENLVYIILSDNKSVNYFGIWFQIETGCTKA